MSVDYKIETLGKAEIDALWAKIKATFVLKAGDTVTGLITMPQLKISDTNSNKHIEFSRQGWNYITVPSTNGILAINVAGTNASATSYAFTGTELRPGSNKAFSLGTASYQWNNIYGYAIYEDGTALASKYAGITLESYFANGILKSDNMPTATSSVLGGVKVGSTLAISSGTLNQKSGICTAGTYRSVTVDTYGRVTAGTNPTTLAGYEISDANINGDVITLGSNTIQGVTDGTQTFAGAKTFSSNTYHNGHVLLGNNQQIQSYLYDSTTLMSVMYVATSNDLAIGNGIATSGYNTLLSGNNVILRYGTSRTRGFVLASSGDVGIGDFNPSASTPVVPEAKLHVKGPAIVTGATTLGSTLTVSGDITPSANSTSTSTGYSLGASSYRFRYVYGRYLNISSTSTLSSTVTCSSTVRMANNTSFQMRTTETDTPYRTVLTMTTGNEFQVGYSGLNMRVVAQRTDFDERIVMGNDKQIGWIKSDATVLGNMISLNGGNVFVLGYSSRSSCDTVLYGRTISQYVADTKITEVNNLGITSYGGVAAMGIADLSIN